MKKLVEIGLTCTEGTSNKFWRGTVWYNPSESTEQYSYIAVYGRIGSRGTDIEKKFSTPLHPFNLLLGKIKEKLKKGYQFSAPPQVNVPEDAYTDLRLAVGKFFSAAKRLPGWIDTAGIADAIRPMKPWEKTKSKPKPAPWDDLDTHKPTRKKLTGIQQILENRKKTAPISI